MDHYYIPSPAENGPRVAELKLIFLRGGGGGEWVGEELCWSNIHLFRLLELLFKTGAHPPEWDISQRNRIDICSRAHAKATDQM